MEQDLVTRTSQSLVYDASALLMVENEPLIEVGPVGLEATGSRPAAGSRAGVVVDRLGPRIPESNYEKMLTQNLSPNFIVSTG